LKGLFSRLKSLLPENMKLRRPLALTVALLVLVPPVDAGGAGTGEIIDEGTGQFPIEVPVTVPPESVPVQNSRPEGEPVLFEESGAGIGFIAIMPDTIPTALYLDGREVVVDRQGMVFPVAPGRHYVSLFTSRDVYLAFRDELPERFWQRVAPATALERFALMSSYEREAVRSGTRWLSLGADDTAAVSLSSREVAAIYRRQATTAAITFFSVTAVIAAAMVGSVVLITRDGE
jgi:hypothetical protein